MGQFLIERITYRYPEYRNRLMKMKLFFTYLVGLFAFVVNASEIPPLDTEWWKHTNIYEIILYSFKDADGDGFGDLRGLTSKLDHFVDLGIETLYFTPIFKSGMKDMGYDITNYVELDPRYGTMGDLEELIRQLKVRGMKLVLDLVINHSSNEHEWFEKSVDRIEPYTDYYVWVNAKNYTQNERYHLSIPNEWPSIFGGPAWTWNEKRQQYYYHRFLKEQPDLNLRNEYVKAEVKKIIKFWLDKGVSGLRLDASFCYIEDKYLREDSYYRQDHYPETFHVMHEFRMFLDEYNRQHGGSERFFVAEVHGWAKTAALYYGTKDYPIAHFPFNYYFNYLKVKPTPVSYDQTIDLWLEHVPEGQPPAWVSQDHDQPRSGSRVSPEHRDIITITTAFLPGIVHYYYGVEIGLLNGYIQTDQKLDVSGDGTRDPVRLLMQWDSSLNAGFTTNEKAIVPSTTDYYVRNVEEQKKRKISHYNILKAINKFRKTDTVKYGKYQSLVYSSDVHIFWRSYENHETFVVVSNLGEGYSTVNLNKITQFPTKLTVVIASVNSNHKEGDKIGFHGDHEFILRPLSSVVFTSSKLKNQIESEYTDY